MLNHLIATIMICLGVANTTPISNCKENHVLTATKKNATITANYSLELTKQFRQNNGYNYSSTSENPIDFGNGFVFSVNDTEELYSIYGNNNYINVLGNIYRNRTKSYGAINQQNQLSSNLIYNYSYTEQNDRNDNKWASRIGYMYKITTYNFNVETTITLTNYIDITTAQSWETLNKIYLKKTVLVINNDERLNELVGVTTTTANQAFKVKEQITNINNGFYYTEDISFTEYNVSQMQDNIENTTNINLLPNSDNFIYIEYQPQGLVNNYTSPENHMTNGAISNARTITINGTNIIPDGTYEVVDIPGLMFEVIGMPFAFVSQAFNLTLFPGTPYQINIANLFLSIMAIFVFVWLLLLFIKIKAGG